MAPITATTKLPKLKPSTRPKPKKVLIQPPTTAPITPRITVIISPPPSLPGIIHLAIIPAIRPKMIHERIPIEKLLSFFCLNLSTRKTL
ncbi:hypothetical protein ETA_19340 [Erwinia tasmaniensis Et1/99]|uniref:Uncharacterized protein n=1 Tax=Erwinia tasmaniensis (strain DSM 17950 / CFBP 7177 / CIP 109463 / NCPPB 4357 / Et1/99) TaxID=465817 RepID=B2VDT9_ERWT9|nr:hypothetical protein ETA_19340 [Erwinia tasmaniensis Et1/99]